MPLVDVKEPINECHMLSASSFQDLQASNNKHEWGWMDGLMNGWMNG